MVEIAIQGLRCEMLIVPLARVTTSSVIIFQLRKRKANSNAVFYMQDKWSSAYDCKTILLSIQSLLGGL